LIVLSRLRTDLPLVVAANRDERLDRPATAMAVLRDDPRTIGGRDELAGGTWLAVNEAGVVAGLTNRPLPDGRDPTKRSRGELPLALTAHRDAGAAVAALREAVDPTAYNPAWLLVGDREALFAVEVGEGRRIGVRALEPGVHILENRPFGAPSPKVAAVRALLGDIVDLSLDALTARLAGVLADHSVPAMAEDPPAGTRPRPPETEAACVHGEQYGTRWSAIVRVPADEHAPPSVAYADGPPCRAPFQDAGLRTLP
jgi:uncharacterized protein with NRDE domain